MKNWDYRIWLEFEQWAEGEHDPLDCNSDVIVSFEKGESGQQRFLLTKIFFRLQIKTNKAVNAYRENTSGLTV